MSENYELVLDGYQDDSEETLRRVRGVFVTDLEFEADSAQLMLSNVPAIVKSSSDKSALEKILKILEEAGACVRISGPDEQDQLVIEKAETTLGPVLELDTALWGEAQVEPLVEKANPAPALAESSEFSLELGDPIASAPAAAAPVIEAEPTPTATVQATPAAQAATAAPESDGLEFSLEEPVIAAPATTPAAAAEKPKSEPAPEPVKIELSEAAKKEEAPAPPKSSEQADVPTPDETLNSMRLADAQKVKKITVDEPQATAVAEPEAAATEAETVPAVSKRTMILAVVCASLSIIALNWYLFGRSKPSASEDRFEQVAATMKVDQPAKVVPKKVEEPINMPDPFESLLLNFEGSLKDNGIVGSWKVTTNGSVIQKLYLEFSTPQPADLTPEEIVRNTPARPWLRKIEFDEANLMYIGDGQFQGQGPARVYVERGSKRDRLVIPAQIEGSFKPNDKSLVAKFILSNWTEAESGELSYAIGLSESGEILTYLRAAFESLGTEPLAEPSPPAP